jgi:hypothetical protein
MPVLTFASKDEIPEGLEDSAKQNGDKWEVNVVPKAKLDEFRDNNIALAEERDTLKATNTQLSGLIGEDADNFKTELEALRKTAQQVSDGKLKKSDDIEKEVDNRVKQMKEQLEAQLIEAENKNKTLTAEVHDGKKKYANTVVDRHITDAVLKEESGVNPSALPDILSRARSTFKVNEKGEVVAMKDENVVMYGSDGATPMTADEWVTTLKKAAPHFFKGNTGGGAGGSDGNNKYPNGMSQEEFQKLPAQQRLAFANQALKGKVA